MALVIIARQIDISVGSQFSVCSVCAGLLAARGWPLALVLPASIAIGAALGAFNAVLVAGLRLPSIVVTLATMVTLRQGLNPVRQGEFVNLPDSVQWLGLSQRGGQWLLVAVALGLLAALGLGLRHLAAGRLVYAVGTDAEASRLAGHQSAARHVSGLFGARGADRAGGDDESRAVAAGAAARRSGA
jgi:rhamnose transport system permease protein